MKKIEVRLDGATDVPANELLVAQTRLLYAGLPLSIAINLLLAVILVWVQSAVIAPSRLWSWCTVMGIVLLGRAALLLWHRHRMDIESHNVSSWLWRFRLGAMATGAAWGLGSALLFPSGDMLHQAYFSIVLAGLSAGAVSFLAADRVSAMGFLLPMLVPSALRAALEGDPVSVAISAMGALFIIALSANVFLGGRTLQENIALRLRAQQREQMLRDHQERLSQAQVMAHIGSWELDLRDGSFSCSDQIYRIFEIERSPAQTSYSDLVNAVHPQDKDAVGAANERSLQLGEPYEISHRLLLPNGRVKWVIQQCQAHFDTAGKPIRFVGAVQDITSQKQAQEESERQIRNQFALLNSIRETALMMELDGTLRVINQVGAERLKHSPRELTGRNIFDFLPRGLARVRRERLAKLVHSGVPETFEDVISGSHFLTTVYPIADASGAVSRFAVYSADVTQERLMQSIEELFLAINHRVLQGVPLNDLLHFICSEVVRLFELELIWLGRKEPDGSVSTMTHAGRAAGYMEDLRRIGVRWDDSPQGRGGSGTAIRSGRMQITDPAGPGYAPWREVARHHNFQALLSIPLLLRGEVFGAFTLYSRKPNYFTNTSDLLVNISTRISVALDAAMNQQQIRLLSSALAETSNGVMITGASGTIQWINPAFSRLSGYSKEELIGQNPRMLSSGRHGPAYYQNMWETITQGRIWRGETEERTKAGTPYTVSQIITPMKNDDGEITHFIAIHEDITAQKQVQQRIEQMAHYDALTGLPNRALFYDRLKHSLSLARRHHGELVLMFLDLDGFKKVNDTLGHRAGDMLLSQVAQRLRQCVRESDTVARLGGDEFTVICNDLYQGFDAARIAEKLIESIAQPFDLEGQAAHIGVSIGIARLCEHTRDPDELLHQADQAMYEAKLAGKNTYRLSISA